jgi:hypothetical protein
MHVKHFGIYHCPTNTLMPHKNASVSHRYWNPWVNNNRQGPKLWSNKEDADRVLENWQKSNPTIAREAAVVETVTTISVITW